MIRAVFHTNQDHGIASFEMTGHADHGDYGQDIVCAAVSALAIATVNGLERVVKQPATITADHANGGLLKVSSIDPGHDSQILLQTFLEAMLDIQEQYAENIDIKMHKQLKQRPKQQMFKLRQHRLRQRQPKRLT